MTDQSPTREELIERLEEPWERMGGPTGWKINRIQKDHKDAISLLRSDSQRIAELEGRLNGLSQGAKVAHPSVRPEEPSSAGKLEPKTCPHSSPLRFCAYRPDDAATCPISLDGCKTYAEVAAEKAARRAPPSSTGGEA